jgi:hypothetical protein
MLFLKLFFFKFEYISIFLIYQNFFFFIPAQAKRSLLKYKKYTAKFLHKENFSLQTLPLQTMLLFCTLKFCGYINTRGNLTKFDTIKLQFRMLHEVTIFMNVYKFQYVLISNLNILPTSNIINYQNTHFFKASNASY